jgi:hypothetical protein
MTESHAHLEQALARAWDRLGQAGTWFLAAERVAIAAETRATRSCGLCARRKAALSPYGEGGDHGRASELSPDVVDAVHRITTDPGRLTRTWRDGLAMTDAEYVELVGVVITAVGIDTFDRALGRPVRALPPAQTGAPSRQRPQDATDVTAWVPMRKIRGLPNVARALTLVPAEARALIDLISVEYVPPERLLDVVHDPGRAISRAQMELVAGRVSALNGCFY